MLLHFSLAALLWLCRVFSAIPHTGAQVVPSSWRMPNITTAPADRVSLAGAAIDKAVSNLTSGQFYGEAYGVPGSLYQYMAEFDLATGQKKYQSALTQYFPMAQAGNRGNFSDELTYGRAATRAYAAYGDPTFLDYAVQNWWFGNSWTISAADAAAGSTPSKSFTLAEVCSDSNGRAATMAGGTFWETDAANTKLYGLATGNFLILSSLLAEATSDPLYLSAAAASVDFMHSHLYNSTSHLVLDSIGASSCSVSDLLAPYNSGLLIHGLAILANVTGNATFVDFLDDILTTAVPNPAWQGPNGIIGDPEMAQGLSAVFARNTTKTAAMRAYVEAYFAVQYNAVLGLATTPGTNIYAGSWTGPPSNLFAGVNQTNALGPLVGALSFTNDSTPTSSGSSSSGSAAPSKTPANDQGQVSKKTSQGPIIGGVVGGVVLLASVTLALFLIRRRKGEKRRRMDEKIRVAAEEPVLAAEVQPFTPWRVQEGRSGLREREYTPYSDGHMRSEVSESRGLSGSTGLSAIPGSGSDPSQRPREKRARGTRPAGDVSGAKASVSTSQTGAANAASGSGSGSSASPPPPPAAQIPSLTNLPTEELVRLLNERLQSTTHQWDEEELPPDYGVPGL